MKNQKKLFENVSGNQFKLITESITETIQGSELVREGLKKIFANGSKEISYQRIAGVGTGYIKDITTARKCALQESRDLAPSYGYIPNDNEQKFVKEEDGEMSDYDREEYENETSPEEPEKPEENEEVKIGKSILSNAQKIRIQGYDQHSMANIEELAQKLIKTYQSKPPYSGTPHLTGGHGGF